MKYRGAWASTTVIAVNDVVERLGVLWRARASYGTTAPAPDYTRGGYWQPMSLPNDTDTQAPINRFSHQFNVASRNTLVGVSSVLNEYQTRIYALEQRLAAAGIA